MKDINKRQRAEGRGQKFTCSDGDLDPKRISLKDNPPSASCLLPPAFQGVSLVNKQNIVTATAKTSTTSDSFSDVVTILNNPDTLTQLGIMVGLLVLSLFLSQKTNQITTARFVNNGDKLQATRKAIEQIESVKTRSMSALYPLEWYGPIIGSKEN